MQKNIHGLDGFVWAIGVVEDRFDPLLEGRCKVRYFHHHTPNKDDLPTDLLPWSIPALPLNHGTNVVGPAEGDWVLGFFLDGILGQQPIMLATWSGYPERPANPDIGFYDPRPASLLVGHKVPRDPEPPVQHDDGSGTEWDERSPKSRFPEERWLKESRFSRLGRNEKIDETIVQQKRDNRFIGQIDIPTAEHVPGTGTDEASPGGEFSEPEIPYAAEYPYNKVYQSEGGHFVEIDDSPNHERIHIYHRLGTFIEIHPTGMKVTKNVQDDFEITLKNKFEHVEAAHIETVDWNKKTYVNKDKRAGFNYDQTVGAGGNWNITTEDGKANFRVNGDINMYTTKDMYLEVDGNLNTTVHKDYNLRVDGNYNISVGGNRTETVGALAVTMAIVISDVAKIFCLRGAGFNISDTAPIISHNTPITNCTGALFGVTVDNDGDITPAGPPGMQPITNPLQIINIDALISSLSLDSLMEDVTSLIPVPSDIQALIDNPLEMVSSFLPSNLPLNPNAIPGLPSVSEMLAAVGGVDGLMSLANSLGSVQGVASLISSIGAGNFSGVLSALGGVTGLSDAIAAAGSISNFTSLINQAGSNITSVLGALGNATGIADAIASLGSIDAVTGLIGDIGGDVFSSVFRDLGGLTGINGAIPAFGGFEGFASVVSAVGSGITTVANAVGGLQNVASMVSQFGNIDSVGSFLSAVGSSNFQGLMDSIGGLNQVNALISAVGDAQSLIGFVKGLNGGAAFNIALQAVGGVEGLGEFISKAGGLNNAQVLLAGIVGGYGSALPTK